MKASQLRLFAIGVLATAAFAGCRSAYYSTMEKMGIEKRDILVDRVEDARDAQQEAKEQFASALEEFSVLIDFQGGDLEKIYDRLNGQLADSRKAASRIAERIESIEQLAKDLFREWNDELDLYANDSLRRESEAQLQSTVQRYDELIAHMRRAEAKIDPVLAAFRDQVLFLKHNLNANAVSALQDEVSRIASNASDLIEEMQAAIDEANAFIESMQ